jgi:hypothetical protein
VTAGIPLDDYLQLAMELGNKLGGLVKVIDHGVACVGRTRLLYYTGKGTRAADDTIRYKLMVRWSCSSRL